jgi:hypothetical protein
MRQNQRTQSCGLTLDNAQEVNKMELKRGDDGEHIVEWQAFLAGLGHFRDEFSPHFGPKTEAATKKFQQAHGLPATGRVDAATMEKARAMGWQGFNQPGSGPEFERPEGWLNPDWPSPLDADHDSEPDIVYRGSMWREATFGRFAYVPAPTSSNPERIRIVDGWDSENIIRVGIPQLKRVEYAPTRCEIDFHQKAAPQLQSLFADWETREVLPFVKTWGGSFVPRFIRGSRTTLSNHAYGTAFDINVPWNMLGHMPARVGEAGTVRPLVRTAEEHGFFWGGRYASRKDGMHFEVMELK